jgi:hypothetical protein
MPHVVLRRCLFPLDENRVTVLGTDILNGVPGVGGGSRRAGFDNATSFNHVICSDEHCFASRPRRVYLLTANHAAQRQCERQQRHHHSERDPPVRYQPFILYYLDARIPFARG